MTTCTSEATLDKSRIGMPGITHRFVVHLGFVRLLDAAPYIIAKELGFFRRERIQVKLSREVGWATIRNKLSFGALEVAQALAPMPFAMTLGLSCPQIPAQALMVTSRNGNAITLSDDLWKRDVRTVEDLAREIRGTRSLKRYTFGVVSLHSTHDLILRQWLSRAGIKPDEDVQIVVLPPEQMVRCLISGHIDGFCVGEPWNSVAVKRRIGWCPAVSADLHPGHPEKVLLCRRDFASSEPELVHAAIRAMIRACEWCESPDNTRNLLQILSRADALNIDAETLQAALCGCFPLGHDHIREKRNFMVFHGNNANRPCDHQARWIIDGMQKSGQLDNFNGSLNKLANEVFDPGPFDAATR